MESPVIIMPLSTMSINGDFMDNISRIANELGLSPKQVKVTVDLLGAGATLPFIARYRKEMTGSLDEVALAAIRDKHAPDFLDVHIESRRVQGHLVYRYTGLGCGLYNRQTRKAHKPIPHRSSAECDR